MRRPRGTLFDVGLAAGGCLVAFPAALWTWPVIDSDDPPGLPLLAGTFVLCYALVRVVDRVADGLEAGVGGWFRRWAGTGPGA